MKTIFYALGILVIAAGIGLSLYDATPFSLLAYGTFVVMATKYPASNIYLLISKIALSTGVLLLFFCGMVWALFGG